MLVVRFRGIAAALLSITLVTSALALVYAGLRAHVSNAEWLMLIGGIVFPLCGALYIRRTANIKQGLVLTNLAGIAVVVGWALITGGIGSIALPWLIANLGLICTFGSLAIPLAIGITVIAVMAGLYMLTRFDLLPASIIGAEALPEMHALALISSATLMVFAAIILAGERARAKARLHEALERAEMASRVKSTFLSSMSHEFRTPLSAVLGYAEVLREDQPPLAEEQRAHLTRIVEAAEHLSALVNQVLDMADLEAGSFSLTTAPVSVDAILRSAYSMMSLEARARNIALLVDLPAEDIVISADETRLRQVLINLISNAIRYNRPGGTVTVHARCEDECVRFEVEDTGRGIAATRQSEVFVPFARLGVESGALKGSGLGLVISRRLVELMGGTIGFRSADGVGSSFHFVLPLDPTATASA